MSDARVSYDEEQPLIPKSDVPPENLPRAQFNWAQRAGQEAFRIITGIALAKTMKEILEDTDVWPEFTTPWDKVVPVVMINGCILALDGMRVLATKESPFAYFRNAGWKGCLIDAAKAGASFVVPLGVMGVGYSYGMKDAFQTCTDQGPECNTLYIQLLLGMPIVNYLILGLSTRLMYDGATALLKYFTYSPVEEIEENPQTTMLQDTAQGVVRNAECLIEGIAVSQMLTQIGPAVLSHQSFSPVIPVGLELIVLEPWRWVFKHDVLSKMVPHCIYKPTEEADMGPSACDKAKTILLSTTLNIALTAITVGINVPIVKVIAEESDPGILSISQQIGYQATLLAAILSISEVIQKTPKIMGWISSRFFNRSKIEELPDDVAVKQKSKKCCWGWR